MDNGFDSPKPIQNAGSRIETVNSPLETDPLLQVTIFNKDKATRAAAFEQAWAERWKSDPKVNSEERGRFDVGKDESPFSEFSSKGWKIHLAFEKGKERVIAEFLYVNGLYFKVESVRGTYFNGTKESGATIYIGSHNNMMAIANVIEQNLGSILTDGPAATYPDGRKTPLGSGVDMEIKPRIMARFDVAKTAYGWISGNKKYTEKGLPSWLDTSGLPILKSDEQATTQAENKWGSLMPSQRKIYMERTFRPAVERAKTELAKDFGPEFVFGKK